jgi:hypothetical protein
MVKKIIETVRGREYVARNFETLQEALDSIPPHLDRNIRIELISWDLIELPISLIDQEFTLDS